MRKDNKIRKEQRRSVIFSAITGIFTVLCIGIVVLAVFACFTGYVFSDLYVSNAKECEKVTNVMSEHLSVSKQNVDNYANGISEFLNTNYAEYSIENEELKKMFEIISSGNDFVNLGIRIYGDGYENIGTLAADITNTNLYSNALEGKYGVGYEIIDENGYITYTSPIKLNDREIGVLYATECGELKDAYYDFSDNETDKKTTGLKVCYIVDQDNNIVAFSGKGSIYYKYDTANMQRLNEFENFSSSDKAMEMYVEYANSKFGMVGDHFTLRKMDDWFSDYRPTSVVVDNFDDNIDLSTIWYKKKIVVPGSEQIALYTWIKAETYIEYDTVSKIVYAAFISVFVLLVPFLLLLISMVSKIRSNKKMAGLLYLDGITGYGNWLFFEESAGKILKKRRNRDQNFAIVSFEINKYRVMLDYYGDNFQEEILGYVSLRLKKWMNRDEVYARYAEAQYGMILKYDSESELLERVKEILDDISAFIINKKISFKAGVYLIEDKTMSVNTLNLIAIGAKDSKEDVIGTKVIMYSSKIREQQRKESMLEESMEKALANREFKVYLQPKYSPDTEELLGAEALVRWISDEKGFISPGEFIPVFEKNGFITKLDDYMIDEVAKLQAKWKAEGKQIVPVSVNVSRIHFSDTNLAEHIKEIVDKYDIEHKFIEIELTESAFFDDKQVMLDTIQKLHNYGFIVSMDDFGSGYSSLNSLKNLPLDVIKLDGEFFNESEDKERGETVVKNTIILAKDLNMKIVAEGIETKEQVDFLEEQGCDLIQGFYFSKPMPVDEFGKFI